jgi:hypothetical protein
MYWQEPLYSPEKLHRDRFISYEYLTMKLLVAALRAWAKEDYELSLFSYYHLDVMPYNKDKVTDVSGEHTASVYSVEVFIKQPTSNKQEKTVLI